MKIVSLLPSATEIVYALGLGDELVGVTDECDFPADATTKPVVSRTALPQDRPLSPGRCHCGLPGAPVGECLCSPAAAVSLHRRHQRYGQRARYRCAAYGMTKKQYGIFIPFV